MKKLSIIIPVYNEEKTVEQLLKKVLSIHFLVKDVEFLVVDDGSSDSSASIIAKFAKTHQHVTFIKHEKNKGKGAAVRTAIQKATGDYLVIQDADLEYDPAEINKLIEPIEQGKAEVVYGTRLKRLPNFSRDERTPKFLLHYLGNKFLSLLTSILYFSWITDMESCYKLFPKKAVDGMTINARGFEFEPEITAKLLKRGYKILEIPISTNPRSVDEGKKLDTFRDGRRAVLTLLRYRFEIDKRTFWLGTGVIVLAILMRFIDYHNRFGLAYDQAHDALLARYALDHWKLPLLGPFSSAGPFQTGGEWYWFIMIGTALYPSSFITPWIFMTVLYVFFVFLLMLLADEIGGKKFALIAGLLAAVSTSEIVQSTNLTNQSPLALVSLFGIWCAIKYLKNSSPKYLFWLGLCIGIGSSIHLSGVALGCLFIALLIVKRKLSVKGLLLFILGVFIPWIPVFLADSQNNFHNTKSMIQYYLHDQYQISLDVLGRRWLTYIGVFWPTEWAFIIGGFPVLGYVEIVLMVSIFIFRKYLTKQIMMLVLSTLFMITLLRYTHTPLFESYLVFIHPFVLLLTAWIVYIFFEWKKPLGILLIVIIMGATFYQDYLTVGAFVNNNVDIANKQVAAVTSKFPGKKFAVYTDLDLWKEKNYILSLFLTARNLSDENGIKIGIVTEPKNGVLKAPVIEGKINDFQLYNLNAFSKKKLQKNGWRLVDGESIYFDTEEWFTEHQ